MFTKVFSYFNKLINSVFFPIIVACYSALFYILGIQNAVFIMVIVVGSLIFICQKNTTPIIPLVLAFIIGIRESSKISELSFSIPLFIPAILSIIIHFIRFRIKFTVGSLFVPFILISIALFLGGIGSEYNKYYNDGIANVIVAGLLPFVLYLLFYPYVESDELLNLKHYLASTLVAFGIFVGIETLALYTGSFFSIVDNGCLSQQEMGWLNTCVAGFVHLLSFGACLYLMVETKKVFLFSLPILFSIAVLFFSKTDGVFGTITFMLPFTLILMYIRSNNIIRRKLSYLIIVLMVIACACLIMCLSWEGFEEYIKLHFMSDSGRTVIYRASFALYRSSYIFGGSLGGAFHLEEYPTCQWGYLHSTFVQVICTMGLFGLLMYIFYFVMRIRIFTSNTSDFSFFMFVSFLAFQCYAMIDTGEFSFMTVFMIFFTVCVEKANKSNPIEELPLIKQIM